MGELFVMLGIVLFLSGGLGILPILATSIGIALSLDSIRVQLVIFDISGSALRVPMSMLDRKAAWNFARTVNTVVISRAQEVDQLEWGAKLGVVVDMPSRSRSRPAVSRDNSVIVSLDGEGLPAPKSEAMPGNQWGHSIHLVRRRTSYGAGVFSDSRSPADRRRIV